MKCCKVCYTENFYPRAIENSNLVTFANALFKSQGLLYLEDFDAPHLLCIECRSQLWKSYTLIQKAACAQKAIQVLEKKKNISVKTWQNLRKQYGLFSTLGYHKVEINDCITADDQDPSTECEIELNDDIIKQEINDVIIKEEINNGIIEEAIEVKYQYPEDKTFDSAKTTTEQNCMEMHLKSSGKESKKSAIKKKETTGKYIVRKPSKKKSEIVDTGPRPVDVTVEHIIDGKRRRPLMQLVDTNPALSDSDTENTTQTPKRTKTDLRGTPRKKKDEEDYNPDASDNGTNSDTSGEYYNDKGKRLMYPKRIYPRPCDLCGLDMSSGYEHYRHYVVDHKEEDYPYKNERRKAICEHCGKLYITQNLADHKKTHGELRTVKCLVCDKKYFTKKKMLSHVKSVHAEKRLICDYCGKGFSEKQTLTLHIRTHTGQKPYKCHICGVGYAHGGNLQVHIRNIHQNISQSTENKKGSREKGKRKKKVRKIRPKTKKKVERSSSEDSIMLSCLKDRNMN